MLRDYLNQLCDAFSDAISISDKNGTMVLVNKKYSELTGLSGDAVLGKSVIEMVNKGLFDVVLNPEVVESKQQVTRIQTIASGRKLILEGNPVIDGNGEVVFVVTFMRDVTALTELRKQIAKQKELLETFQSLHKNNHEYPEIFTSAPMRKLHSEIDNIAETDATVLLLGETGVGKDIVSRAIHRSSPRADKVFIKVDCGSIPENLIETELFGYVTGTFSGASKHGKVGLIEAASSGTLFLDEVGELPLNVQSRLLRFLQDREVMRVGSTTPKRVDARIIAATNKDLEKEVSKGRFRSDLYYRLKVAVLKIPPLRRRRDDILPLARSFLAFYCDKYNKNITLSDSAENTLLDYSWPGNVRELENLVQSLVITSKKNILERTDIPINHVPSSNVNSSHVEIGALDLEGKSFKDIMKDLETAVIKAGLKRYGTITEVAKHFQVDRSTIFRKVKEIEGQ